MSTTFRSLGVPEDIAGSLAARGILEPFPIQAASLPDALAGHDVSGRAATGSGKTLAFGIPLVVHTGRAQPRRPLALVLVPTRELAAQVASEIQLLGGTRKTRVATFYGGVGFGAQLKALERGVDIAVACPGRLLDLIDRRAVRLDSVVQVVVDEADRMADMGFLPVVRQLLDQVSSERQTMLFSATLDGDVDELVRRYQRNPLVHSVVSADEDTSNSVHHFWHTEREQRVGLTAQIASGHGSTIVFCRTRHGVDRLTRQLQQSGLTAVSLHGDRTQAQRDRALASFRAREAQVLVSTDVAARGIHVDDVGCVVQFDPPEDEKAYIHRAGRTGRAGSSGVVVTLVTEDQARAARRLQADLGMEVRIVTPEGEVVPPQADEQRRPNDERSPANRSRSHGSRPNRPGAVAGARPRSFSRSRRPR